MTQVLVGKAGATWVAVLTVILCLGAPSTVVSQVVDGRVLDEFSEHPIRDALILLLSSSGELLQRASSGPTGDFSFAPSPGSFHLQVVATGYQSVTVGPIPLLDPSSVYPVDLLLEPRPIALSGLDVVAEPYATDMARLGLRLDEVRRRLITRDMIEQRVSARGVGQILEWNPIPGVRISRREQAQQTLRRLPGPTSRIDICVTMPRGRSFDGFNQCAAWILDGRTTSEDVIKLLDPQDIEAVVVLTPSEAALLYGTGTFGGAVVVYTRRGSSR